MGDPVSLGADEFDLVRDLVRERSGIALGDGKQYLVEARLAPIAEREGVDSVAELIALVRRDPVRYASVVADALATNETSFFRDVHPFDALREIIGSLGRPPSIWCAAASTGQEPYSVAMLLATHFADLAGASILATDLGEDVLRHAATGCYSQLEVNRGLPAPMLVRFFTRKGVEWQVAESIRARVTFRQLNLARPLPPIGPFDVVLLRNVLIYFDAALKTTVLNAVAKVLRPGGYLLLGAAESTFGLAEAYERVQVGQSVCYRIGVEQARSLV